MVSYKDSLYKKKFLNRSILKNDWSRLRVN